MGFDWSGRTPISIYLPPWPISEDMGSGRERVRWTIQTLDGFSVAKLEAGLARFPVVPAASLLNVSVEVVAPDELLMVCEFDSAIPEPMRLGAASVTWRLLDEKLARLWMIGGRPRSQFPEFMRQLRVQLDDLSMRQRLSLMLASVARIEPLIAMTGEGAGSSRLLLDCLATEDDLAALGVLGNLTSRLSADLGLCLNRRVFVDTVKSDLGILLLGLHELVAQAMRSRTTDSIASCIEEVFNILFLVDCHYGISDCLLSRREDRDFRDDLQILTIGDAGGPEKIVDRCFTSADSVQAVVTRADVRQQLIDAISE